MRHFHLNQHSERCKNTDDSNDIYRYFCDANPRSKLFYIGGEFCLVTYFDCIRTHSELDFFEGLIKDVFNSKKNTETYNLRRSWNVNEDFRNSRLKGKCLNAKVNEVHYLYCDNAARLYAISSLVNHYDTDEIRLNDEYKRCKEYLIHNGFDNILNDLENLYEENKYAYYDLDRKEVFLTVNSLIKQINKQIKQL